MHLMLIFALQVDICTSKFLNIYICYILSLVNQYVDLAKSNFA